MATFTMRAAGVPEGQYRARLVRWGASVHEQYGDRVQFVWQVLDGPHAGREASRYTGAKLTPKSALARIAKGLAGRVIEVGDSFDPASFVGRDYLILVTGTESGSTRVESVMPADTRIAPPFATGSSDDDGCPF